MRAGHRPQSLRQGKGDQKIRDRQEECALLFKPAGSLAVLARGTMPIFAGMIALLEVSAHWTLVDMAAQGLGAALFNGHHGLQVVFGHTVGEFGTIRRAIALEDLRQLDHGSAPATLRGLPGVLSEPRVPWLQL